MKPTKLNTSTLRSRNNSPASFERIFESGLRSSGHMQLSRRKWLGIAGGAALGLSPTLSALGSTLLGEYQLIYDDKQAIFMLGNKARWIIDTRRFSGAPKLLVSREKQKVRLCLQNARFPGTSLPADFQCTIRPALIGSQISIKFSFGFSASAAFEPWLLGREALVSQHHVNAELCKMSPSAKLAISGKARTRFTPDWLFSFEGNQISVLTGFEKELFSSCLTLSMPEPSKRSLIQKKPALRTELALERGDETWNICPSLHTYPSWQCQSKANAFDSIEIEAGENRVGIKRYALLAECIPELHQDEGSALAIAPSPELASLGGEVFSLPLRNPRFAIAFDHHEEQRILVARFDETPVWLSVDHLGMEIGGSVIEASCEDDELELQSVGGQLENVKCSPPILSRQLPLPDALTLPTPAQPNERLLFAQSKGSLQQSTQPNTIQVSPQTGQIQVQLQNGRISAVRPQDLVKIDFEFINLKLSGSGSGRKIVCQNSGSPSYLIAIFPPQNIAEEAFYEATTTSESDPLKPPGKVQALLSGPSRLVFKVPPEALPIPYNLAGLLGACKQLPLNVSPAASVLTTEQTNALKTLQVQTSQLKQSLTAVRGMVQSVRKALSDHTQKRTAQSSSSVQKSVGILEGNARAIQTISDDAGLPQATLKRLQTLQKAIGTYSSSDPKLALSYTEEYNNLLEYSIQKQDDRLSINAVSVVAPAIQNLGIIRPAKPSDLQTSLELPWHLYLSPHSHSGWTHATDPVMHDDRTELWHTRLGLLLNGKVLENHLLLNTVRAIWSEEYESKPSTHTNVPFRMSLDSADRYQIVELSSNFADFQTPQGKRYSPLPISANTLMLSTLGAWMNLYGAWDTPSSLSVESWRHRGTMGRDHYVRVVYKGYLFPFGHKAVLVKVTERKFQKSPNGNDMVAYLRQRKFIVVREPEKTYPADGQQNITDSLFSKPDQNSKKVYERTERKADNEARKTPFRRARITTLVTPNLDPPENSDIGGQTDSAFWPQVGGKDFEFHFVAEDWEGNRFDFTAPLIFVEQNKLLNSAAAAKFASFSGGISNLMSVLSIPSAYVYDGLYDNNTKGRNTRPMYGQRIAIAEPGTPGSTAFETDSLTIGVELNIDERKSLLEQGKPYFFPTIERAKIRVKSLEEIAAKTEAIDIELYPDYLKNGFTGGQVFAKFLDSTNNPGKVGLNFASNNQKSGGLLAPNMNITGLSRSIGAVAGNLDSMAKGNLIPDELFKDLLDDAKLFGAIKLSEIIPQLNGFMSALERVPKFQREVSGGLSKTSFKWSPKVKSGPEGINLFQPSNPDNCLTVSVDIITPLNGSNPTYSIEAALREFALVMKFIRLPFSLASLLMKSGEKADINVIVGRPEFTDELEFMNDIVNAIPLDGFSDPPYIDVSTSGIKTGYSLGLPTIGLGMVTLQNVTLSAELGIPFIGKAMSFTFMFCRVDNPFTATVYCIGGGGYFGLVVEPDGVASLHAAIEFGGSIALNIGIAAGAIYSMVGIYYQYVKSSDGNAFSAYIRMGGSLCVLGMVSVSIEFRLDLTYLGSGKLQGSATLKIKVKIFFAKKTFKRTVTRKIAGTAKDPLFKDVISENDWNEYLSAFAV